ncbi:DUF1499 domain-containing protein [Petrocella sp. FN5]|uniref:DUF1499 domain-containing protein n=1 Tax=Petrocella sp. FN5 TaxID=3032002 RepID=UPI0023DB4B0A|nr:DUF1499 domain-containing protein [Petrocella sp. FN5]MDF1617075.1 DUF1499 domain-containing protein [Petrocella sp. FN5]
MKPVRNRKDKIKMWIAIIVVVMVSGVFISMVVGNMKVSKLGVREGLLAEMPETPNAVSSQTRDEDKKVAPFPYKEDLQTTKEEIKLAVKAYGDAKIVEEESNYIRMVFTTGLMRYKDDVEFYFDDQEKVVHFRSASRIGYSDMGLNRERYNTLYEYYMKH